MVLYIIHNHVSPEFPVGKIKNRQMIRTAWRFVSRKISNSCITYFCLPDRKIGIFVVKIRQRRKFIPVVTVNSKCTYVLSDSGIVENNRKFTDCLGTV